MFRSRHRRAPATTLAALAGSGTFIPGLGLGHDLHGDGGGDLLVPTFAGAAVYLGRGGGLAAEPPARLLWPRDDASDDSPAADRRLARHYPLPEVRDVTIHRGRDGCVYPPDPDLKIRLEEEPRDLKPVRVEDFDGDGRSDLIVIQPQKVTEPGVTPPVRLDMYLSAAPLADAASGGGR